MSHSPLSGCLACNIRALFHRHQLHSPAFSGKKKKKAAAPCMTHTLLDVGKAAAQVLEWWAFDQEFAGLMPQLLQFKC